MSDCRVQIETMVEKNSSLQISIFNTNLLSPASENFLIWFPAVKIESHAVEEMIKSPVDLPQWDLSLFRVMLCYR